MGDVYPVVKVAAVQAASVFLDREGTVEKACSLIRDAGRRGARLIAFPEGFLPGHPLWLHFRTPTDPQSLSLYRRLFANAVAVPGAAVEALSAAAREAGAVVVMGICEKRPGSLGTLYNSHLYLGPDGGVLATHRKLVPTGKERIVHAGGDGEHFGVVQTDFGPVGGLLCGENSNSLARHALLALGERIHVASWPPFFSINDMQEIIQFVSRAYAYEGRIFVVNVVGVVDDAALSIIAPRPEDAGTIRALRGGGSCIIGPNGEILAGPLGAGEEVLYADLNMERIVQAKMLQDFVGHYNRFDVFRLTVHRTRNDPVRIAEPSAEEDGDAGPGPAARVRNTARAADGGG